VRWVQWGAMPSLHDELEALSRRLATTFGPSGFQPPVDVYATGPAGAESINVRVEIAGLDAGSVAVNLDGRMLTITGQRPPAHHDRVVYHHMEISYGPFERRIELPVDVDAKAATAGYDAGYLTVSLPVAPLARDRRVVVVQVMR
jgi:HSP20 family protein